MFRLKVIFCRRSGFIRGKGSRCRDRMVVGFTTTYAFSAYHRWCCEVESRSGWCVQYYVIKFVSDLWQVEWFSTGPPVSSTNKTDHHDITEILLKVVLNTIKQTNSIRIGLLHILHDFILLFCSVWWSSVFINLYFIYYWVRIMGT
jgi:hypothetical protein